MKISPGFRICSRSNCVTLVDILLVGRSRGSGALTSASLALGAGPARCSRLNGVRGTSTLTDAGGGALAARGSRDAPAIVRRWLVLVELGKVKGERLAGVRSDIAANSNQSLAAFIEHIFEADNDALEVATALLDVVANLEHIHIVQSGIDLVHDEEGGRAVRVDGK